MKRQLTPWNLSTVDRTRLASDVTKSCGVSGYFSHMDNSDNSINPEEWRKWQLAHEAGFQDGKRQAEREREAEKTARRHSQRERIFGATFFWGFFIFVHLMTFEHEVYGWDPESEAIKMMVIPSFVTLFFYLTLRGLVKED